METNVINATEDFLRSEITKKDERLQMLESTLTNLQEAYQKVYSNYNRIVESLQEWTMSQLEDGDINEEQATELSEIGSFDLTKEVEAEVTVKYWISLQVPAGESAEDIINEIDFESVSYDSEAITNISHEVSDIDL
jgi:hypothetical protein